MEETFVSALEIYDSNDHERAGMGSTVVKIIASVCEPNETKRKLREKNNNNNNTISIACVRVCVESVYLVVCLSRGTAKTLERCRQRYTIATIATIGTSHTTRQFVFGWVVSEPPLEFIFRECLQR